MGSTRVTALWLIFIWVVSDWMIRRASEHDIERVLSLWNAAGSAETVTDTRDGVLGLLDDDREALLVAESDGAEIVGSLIAAWDGWRGSFYRLAVHPDWRRQGLATALLHEGEHRLQARGAARFTAIVTDDDPNAMGFWAATGYKQQESRARFVRNVAPVALAAESAPDWTGPLRACRVGWHGHCVGGTCIQVGGRDRRARAARSSP